MLKKKGELAASSYLIRAAKAPILRTPCLQRRVQQAVCFVPSKPVAPKKDETAAKAAVKGLEESISEAVDLPPRFIAQAQLRRWIGLDWSRNLELGELKTGIKGIAGATMSVCGTLLQVNDIKVAVLAIVVKEAAKDVKLDGLRLHWGCVDKQGGKWQNAPAIWQSYPEPSIDAGGGARQTPFLSSTSPDGKAAHVLLLQIPVAGFVENGGIHFVLCRPAVSQWAHDPATGKDWFLKLSTHPVTHGMYEVDKGPDTLSFPPDSPAEQEQAEACYNLSLTEWEEGKEVEAKVVAKANQLAAAAATAKANYVTLTSLPPVRQALQARRDAAVAAAEKANAAAAAAAAAAAVALEAAKAAGIEVQVPGSSTTAVPSAVLAALDNLPSEKEIAEAERVRAKALADSQEVVDRTQAEAVAAQAEASAATATLKVLHTQYELATRQLVAARRERQLAALQRGCADTMPGPLEPLDYKKMTFLTGPLGVCPPALPSNTQGPINVVSESESFGVAVDEGPIHRCSMVELMGVASRHLRAFLDLNALTDLRVLNYEYRVQGQQAPLLVWLTSRTDASTGQEHAVVCCVADKSAAGRRGGCLTLRWGSSSYSGGPWWTGRLPDGWTTLPAVSWDAGSGAWETPFDRQQLKAGLEAQWIILSLPLQGTFRSGGLVWSLIDARRQSLKQEGAHGPDFFLDLELLAKLGIVALTSPEVEQVLVTPAGGGGGGMSGAAGGNPDSNEGSGSS